MAKYNELFVGRYNRFLQKLLSMKGPASLESLNPELQAVLLTFHGVENRYLEGWDRFGVGRGVGAQGPGLASILEIRNPGGSNVIAVIESILASTNGAAPTQFILSNLATSADQGGISNAGGPLDPRGRPFSTCITSVGSTALGVDFESVAIAINVPWQFINDESQEIPVLPGQAVLVRSSVLNQAANYTFVWRERFLEDSERA